MRDGTWKCWKHLQVARLLPTAQLLSVQARGTVVAIRFRYESPIVRLVSRSSRALPRAERQWRLNVAVPDRGLAQYRWGPMSSPTSPVGFDAAADRYDADEQGNRVLAHMRARAFQHLCRAFAPGSRLIELGSGTGTEAARMASERGCQVALVDDSPLMLEHAASKVSAARPGALLGTHRLCARCVGQLATIYGEASFDGAYSSFGPLNCEPRLAPVAEGLARLVRSGGTLTLSVINRWCPAEVVWFALHGRWRDMARRWGGAVQAAAYPGGPKDVTTWYYSGREVSRAFIDDFCVEHVEALPLLWPPPYLGFLVNRFERLFAALEPLEHRVAPLPVLRALGDHVLLRLRRR
jgi:SAM-dependent methyltransferase